MSITRKPVVVIGSGGHAKVLVSSLIRLQVEIVGLIDIDPGRHGESVLGRPVIGDENQLANWTIDSIELVNGIGSTANTARRREVYDRLKKRGYYFATVIDPWTSVSSDVMCREGVQIMAGCVVQPGTTLSENCIINSRAVIDHDCVIGAHSHIASGATLSGGIRIGEGCHIGSGATIIQSVRVGDFSVVAAGAVVTKNIDAGTLVGGVPARPLRMTKHE